MKEFFHGWRRKTGIVTLVMALAVCAIWGRGSLMDESVALVIGSKMYFISASDFGFECREAFDPPPVDGLPIWWNQGHIAVYHGLDLPGFPMVEAEPAMAVPLWSLLLPLTLFSAYLMLWMPRTPPD